MTAGSRNSRAGRSLLAWITGLAFIAANGAKYGPATVHFYCDEAKAKAAGININLWARLRPLRVSGRRTPDR